MRYEGNRTAPEEGHAPLPQRRIDALDGLRAVSMAVVLLYHGEVASVGGGFLGISLFFTLSGFLITSMLLATIEETGSIDLRTFWGRRYRRLLPAAHLALGLVVLFGATVATEQQLDDLPGAVTAAVAQVANWFFVVTDQSYVDLFAAPSPVQHFWSLAIEEQLYLLLPLGLLAVLKVSRSRRVLLGVIVGAALASTAVMVVLFERGASLDRLYYGTDTRAAELLVGAGLAVVLSSGRVSRTGRWARLAPAVGLACLAALAWSWSSVRLTDAALYKGGFLLAALVSAGLIASATTERGPVAWALARRPLAAFGRITYGVYLFHWPVFLWLTETRTGLTTWPLLVVRTAVTSAVAVASYHLLEMPIRERRWPRSVGLRWAVAPMAVVLVGGGILVGSRGVETDLAGLGEAPSAAPVGATTDEVLDVLVITDRDATALGLALEERADEVDDLRVTVLAPFECSSLDTAEPTACEGWREEWPRVVAEADPDVVLFHVTRWPEAEIEALSGSPDLAARIDWTASVLGAGFDLLTSRGATVVWSQDPVDMTDGLRRTSEAFYPAMQRLTSDRVDARRREVIGRDLDPLLADLVRHRRTDTAGDVLRVMVVGDSTARTIGYGLERWADQNGTALVWSRAVEGCGIADEGLVRSVAGREVPVGAECAAVTERWAAGVDEFDPDLVLVASHIFDLQDRQIPGWPDLLAPGDPAFDDYLVEEYVQAYDVLAASGARVVWFENPCVSYVFPSGDDGPFRLERIRHVNEVVLGRLRAVRPELHTFDLFDVLCPDGEFVRGLADVDVLRPDGVHLSSEGSLWFAEGHGDSILAFARQ